MCYFILDVNECLDPLLCMNGATCMNNPGSYACRCAQGWMGKHCEKGNLELVYSTVL